MEGGGAGGANRMHKEDGRCMHWMQALDGEMQIFCHGDGDHSCKGKGYNGYKCYQFIFHFTAGSFYKEPSPVNR